MDDGNKLVTPVNPIQRARELLEGREAQEAEHEVWRERHSDELLNIEIDALLDRTQVNKNLNGNTIVYKRRDEARVTTVPPQPSTREGYMDPRSQGAWDDWARSVAVDALHEELPATLNDMAKIIGEEVGAIEREMRADFDKQLAALKRRIAKLERK